MDHEHRSRRATAFHEAGHAVIAMLFGRGVDRLRLLDSPDAEGVFERSGARWPSSDHEFHQEIMILLAGPVAERIATEDHTTTGWELDLKHAGILATRCSSNPIEMIELVRALEHKTASMLRRPCTWARVCALADALLDRGEVDGRAANEIVRNRVVAPQHAMA